MLMGHTIVNVLMITLEMDQSAILKVRYHYEYKYAHCDVLAWVHSSKHKLVDAVASLLTPGADLKTLYHIHFCNHIHFIIAYVHR